MYTNLVLSGGAIKGFYFIGVIQYLESQNLMSYFKTFVGSSAGSMICFLISLGYSSKEIYEHCMLLLQEYIHHNIDFDNFININDLLGIDDCNIIMNYMKKCLQQKLNVNDIDFLTLSKKTGYNLVICASNISQRKSTFFCVDETPNISVLNALQASITIPFIFTPVIINNEIYVDAGIYNNFPIDFIKNFILKDTLGVRILSKEYSPNKPLNLFTYTRLIIDTMLDRINSKDHLLEKIQLIDIDSREEDIFDFDFESMKLEFDFKKANTYIKDAYNTTKMILETAKSIEKNEQDLNDKNTDIHLKNTQNLQLDSFTEIIHQGKYECDKRLNTSKFKKTNYNWVQQEPILQEFGIKFNDRLLSIFDFDEEKLQNNG